MPPAGWYADPEGGSVPRWWDGQAWAARAPQPTTAMPPVPGPPIAPQAYPPVIVPGAVPPIAPPVASWPADLHQTPISNGNGFALTAMGMVAVYLVITALTGFYFVGVIPVVYAVRSFRGHEKLAPLALVVAIVGVVAAIALSVHRTG